MKFQYYWGKFRWWLIDHLCFYPNLLGNEVEMKYALPEGYDNFAVHPCVRYIQEGIGGNKWWMVLTPYKNYDITQENILLFRGVDGTDNSSPTEWYLLKNCVENIRKGIILTLIYSMTDINYGLYGENGKRKICQKIAQFVV